MRTKLLSLLMLPALLLILGGCDYERVDIIVNNELYSGRTMSHYENVEVRPSGVVLKPGARFSIMRPNITQFLGQFEVAILSGEGMTAYLRTVPHEFDTSHGIAFLYSTNGCQMRMPDGEVVPLEYNAETNQQLISLYNEAALVSVSVGCNRLFERPVDTDGTEYVIFETLPGSTIELRSVNFFNTDVQ